MIRCALGVVTFNAVDDVGHLGIFSVLVGLIIVAMGYAITDVFTNDSSAQPPS